MSKPKPTKPARATVSLNASEHRLAQRVAHREHRTIQGVVTLALLAYAKKHSAILAEVYGDKEMAA